MLEVDLFRFFCSQEILQSVDQTIKDNEKQKVRREHFFVVIDIKYIVKETVEKEYLSWRPRNFSELTFKSII